MSNAFRLGPWVVEPDLNRLKSDSIENLIEPKSMAMLVILAQRQGQLVSTEELIAEIWGGRAMGDNPVYKTVAKLRKALGDDGGASFVETVSKKGYRLNCPVLPIEAGAPSATGSAHSVPLHIVAIAAMLVMGIAAFLVVRSLAPAAPTAPVSIAVLPFSNFGASSEDAYFADGLAEEILNRLAQSPELRVVARTSSFQFRDQARDVTEIGAALGAAYLIEGSVRRNEDMLRITAQLVDANTGYHLWSDTFDSERSNIFVIQDNIALAIADALDAKILNDDHAAPTNDLAAWAMYLEGKALWQRKGEGPIRAAIRLYESAVERDPNFAEAWAALSEAWIVLPRFSQSNLDDSVAKGMAAAERAIALDPALAQPYLSLAAYEDRQADFVAGMALTERAFELTPRHTGVLNTMSFNYGRAGWIKEAIVHSRNGVALDPLEGGEHVTLGFLLMVSGDLDGARSTLLRAWDDLGVKAYFLWEGLFEIHILKGELDAAEEWLDVRPSQRGVEFRRSLIAGLRNAQLGDRASAVQTILNAASKREMPLHVAFEYLLLLDAEDEAFEAARLGIRKGEYFMIHHLYKPSAQSLRRQPRVLELADELKIADLWRASGRMPDFCADVAQFYDCALVLQDIQSSKAG